MSDLGVYAYLCVACNHLASRHGLVDGGDLRAGPYRCANCPCEIAQDAPMHKLSKQQYERFLATAVQAPGEFSGAS